MMRKVVFLCVSCLFFVGCFETSDFGILQALNERRQKQRIVSLEKKLNRIETLEREATLEKEELITEIDRAKIALIRGRIDGFEKKNEAASSLFIDEREILYDLIQSGPSPSSFEAQIELDRMLRIMAEKGEEGSQYVF